jgi:hypothetical protein
MNITTLSLCNPRNKLRFEFGNRNILEFDPDYKILKDFGLDSSLVIEHNLDIILLNQLANSIFVTFNRETVILPRQKITLYEAKAKVGKMLKYHSFDQKLLEKEVYSLFVRYS